MHITTPSKQYTKFFGLYYDKLHVTVFCILQVNINIDHHFKTRESLETHKATWYISWSRDCNSVYCVPVMPQACFQGKPRRYSTAQETSYTIYRRTYPIYTTLVHFCNLSFSWAFCFCSNNLCKKPLSVLYSFISFLRTAKCVMLFPLIVISLAHPHLFQLWKHINAVCCQSNSNTLNPKSQTIQLTFPYYLLNNKAWSAEFIILAKM